MRHSQYLSIPTSVLQIIKHTCDAKKISILFNKWAHIRETLLAKMANVLPRIPFFLINLYFVIGPAELTPDQPTTNSNEILPIIFIRHDGKYLYPTDVQQTSTTKRLSFASNTHKREQFFCPAETAEQEEKIKVGSDLSELYPTLEEFHKYIQKNHPEYEEYLKYLKFSKYCLFEKKFESGEPLTCPKEPTFGIRNITRRGENGEEEDERCGRNDAGIKYEFFYLACLQPTFFNKWDITSMKLYFGKSNAAFQKYIQTLPFLTVKHVAYRFCYDHKKKDTLYTRHRLRSNELLFDEKTEYDREKPFEMTIDDYGFFDANHLVDLKNAYEKVETLSKETSNAEYSDKDEKISPESLKYKDHQLVSRGDFSTALWRKPTHHYLNVKPMHKELFALWDYIEDVILKHYRKLNIELEIYTGAFNYESEEKKTVKYMYDNQVQIPDLWIKLVYEFDRKSSYLHGTAIKMYNYIVNEADPCHNSKDLCHPIIDEGIIGKLFPGADDQICCEQINKQHLKYFNLDLEVHSALIIGSLSYHIENGNSNDGSKTTRTEDNVP